MELVSNCPSDLQIYKPSFGWEYPSSREQSEHRSRLLHKIHNLYCNALERLCLRVRPGMAARFLHGGGFCLGLLDPVSNILANAIVSYGRAVGDGDDCELVYVPKDRLRDLECRSLDGMVTFLTRFFPYLADCEAVHFLLVADADLLVAARMVAMDLGMKRFGSSEPAVNDALRMALKCAGLAANHPNPDRLVSDWLAMSGHLAETLRLLTEVHRRSSPSSLYRLAKLLDGFHDGCEDLSGLWRLTAYLRPPPRRLPYQHTPALKGTLQDAIHGFYLRAIARLPAGDLRSRFHRSLLEGGHCYGPFGPVSNIIINTIWYDAAFPPTVNLELDMIGTLSLQRMENRSLYGLLSFLGTRCCKRGHPMDFDQAMHYLLQADVNLVLADRFIDPEPTLSPHSPGLLSVFEEAYSAAATAAYHPDPPAQAKLLLLCSSQPMLRDVFKLLKGDGLLSSEDVRCLARLLCPEVASREHKLSPFPRLEYLWPYTKMSRKIKATLSAYGMMMSGEPMYELHSICGMNNNVWGPIGTAAKCYCSHVNFLATPKGTQLPDGSPPVLFFAEVSNDDEDRDGMQSFCCLVPVPLPCAERVRCLYCDYMGIKIVHPVGEHFHGRQLEFEKMVCGEDPCNDDFDPTVMQPYYTNMNIIEHSSITTERVNGRVEEDRLYSDHSSDGYDSDMSLMSDEYDCDLGSMIHDDSYPQIVSCCRVY